MAQADDDQVRAIFEHEHGYKPTDVVESGPVLLVGPARARPRSLTSRIDVRPMTSERVQELLPAHQLSLL